MSAYPKVMHRGLDEVTVPDASGQADLERSGWIAGDCSRVTPLPVDTVVEVPAEVPSDVPNDPPTFGAADDGTGDEPTEGPADDQTHVRRSRKKK